MALTMERRVGIKLGAWTTVKTALALGLWLVLSQVCWAQDPLNDVHVQPLPPAPTAPVDSKAPDAKAPPAVEGNKALAQPLLQIPIENKAAIVGAINRSCGASANQEKPYLDMAAAVADKVKMN